MFIALYESNELWKKIRLNNPDYSYPIPQAYVGLSMITLILVPFSLVTLTIHFQYYLYLF